VPIILAMTIMEKNAAEYGLQNLTLDRPLEYDTVETSAPTGLGLVADIADISPVEVAALNPAILRSVAPSGFPLHVPKGQGMQVAATLQLVPAERRSAWRIHRVESGETLAAIGKRFGVAASSIMAANNLHSQDTAQGDRLLIPTAVRPEPVAKRPASAATHRAIAPKYTVHRTASAKPAPKRPVMVAKNNAQ